MKQISISTLASTGLAPSFLNVQTIELEDNPIGQGGFGEVYRAISVDGRGNTGQVVKLLFDTGNNAAARGFATIQELQKRLRQKNEELLQASRRSLIEHYPALAGVPQFSFQGNLNGRNVVGYSANDLSAAGMEDFGRVLEDDAKTRKFQALPISSRMIVALQLVRAFHFLSSQIRFIHADIKAEAIFVNFTKLRCAIIDFDSGAVAKDASDKPTTFGTNQDWLAPEIAKQLAASGNASRIIKVDLLSDLWAINIAIHYLLFGFHPLFFLAEISDRSIAEYFRQFQWPAAAPSFKYFRKDLEPIYRQYVSILRSTVPAEVVRQLSFTINKGYTDPTSRATCGQWKTVLDVLNRPAIVRFSADRTTLTDARPVRLSWEVSGATRLDIPGVGEVTSRTSIEVKIRRDTTIELVLTPSQGNPIRKSIQIQVSKASPGIHAFTTSAQLLDRPNPARLAWSVAGAERVEIDNGVGDVSGRAFTDILPKTDTTYTLTATSPFGVVATASVKVAVSKVPPVIHYFRADRAILCDARPVELSWKVCDRAQEVVIDGIGVVPGEGSLRVAQKKDKVYVLRARSAFGYSSESRCTVEVSKVAPRIEVFSADPMFLREGMETEIRWKITGADRATILPKIGSVAATSQVKVRLTQDAQFSLAAESYFGVSATAILTIRVLKQRTFDAGRVSRLDTDGARTLNTSRSRTLSQQVHRPRYLGDPRWKTCPPSPVKPEASCPSDEGTTSALFRCTSGTGRPRSTVDRFARTGGLPAAMCRSSIPSARSKLKAPTASPCPRKPGEDEKPSPSVIVKNVIVAGLAIAFMWSIHYGRATLAASAVSVAQVPPQASGPFSISVTDDGVVHTARALVNGTQVTLNDSDLLGSWAIFSVNRPHDMMNLMCPNGATFVGASSSTGNSVSGPGMGYGVTEITRGKPNNLTIQCRK